MKKVFTLAMIVGFLWGTYAFAGCPLTGNIYSIEFEDTTYELSGFECIYGPGCTGTCKLWEKISASSARYLGELPFTCWEDGTGFIDGCPFTLIPELGNLKIFLVDISNYSCHTIGTRTYCFPEEIESILLNRKNELVEDDCTGINFLLNSNCWDNAPSSPSEGWQYEYDCNYYFPDGHPSHCDICGPCVNGEGPCFANSQCISDYCDQTTHTCQEDPRQSR